MKKINLRREAKGRDCQIRIPRVCNFDPETTVLAHLNGAGMGMKALDIHAAIACSACHNAVDHRIKTGYTRTELELMHHQGMKRTQDIWVAEGFLWGG